MIKTKQFSKHESVLFAEFGNGDIKIAKSRNVNDEHESMLIFYNQTPREIGEEDNEFTGRLTDELQAPGFVMSFSKPESITALIHVLVELQTSMFTSSLVIEEDKLKEILTKAHKREAIDSPFGDPTEYINQLISDLKEQQPGAGK